MCSVVAAFAWPCPSVAALAAPAVASTPPAARTATVTAGPTRESNDARVGRMNLLQVVPQIVRRPSYTSEATRVPDPLLALRDRRMRRRPGTGVTVGRDCPDRHCR